MNLTDKEDTELVAHCEHIKEIVRPHADELALLLNILPQAAMTRLLKPYFGGSDARTKKWSAKIYIWKMPLGGTPAESHICSENDPVTVRGMSGIADLIRDYVGSRSAHQISKLKGVLKMEGRYPFTVKSLAHHLGKMRPAFSRGGGAASTRWYYRDKGHDYMLQADISRVDEETA